MTTKALAQFPPYSLCLLPAPGASPWDPLSWRGVLPLLRNCNKLSFQGQSSPNLLALPHLNNNKTYTYHTMLSQPGGAPPMWSPPFPAPCSHPLPTPFSHIFSHQPFEGDNKQFFSSTKKPRGKTKRNTAFLCFPAMREMAFIWVTLYAWRSLTGQPSFRALGTGWDGEDGGDGTVLPTPLGSLSLLVTRLTLTWLTAAVPSAGPKLKGRMWLH